LGGRPSLAGTAGRGKHLARTT